MWLLQNPSAASRDGGLARLPGCPAARLPGCPAAYADDAVVHCVTERQARRVREALRVRLAELGLELHPGKTRIVYCKDSMRHGEYDTVTFTFLGYAFRPRQVKGKNGKIFTSFTPRSVRRRSRPKARKPMAGGCTCAPAQAWTNSPRQ
jgi:hypothetical protein